MQLPLILIRDGFKDRFSMCHEQVDGVRLISNSASELLRGVPDALADVYRVGSTAPGTAELEHDPRNSTDWISHALGMRRMKVQGDGRYCWCAADAASHCAQNGTCGFAMLSFAQG